MKIGFLITARLKSSRLPLKLLLDVNGKTIVERVIERAKQVAYVEDIILCTSTNSQDKPLVDISMKNDIYYFMGSEEDVLQRLTDAAIFYGVDYFINITGENPLFSIQHANKVAESLLTGKHDFVYIDGLPIGCGVYGLSTKALEVVCKVKKVIDTEIWGTLINQPDIFNVHTIKAEHYFQKFKNTRITSDYFEDYQFIDALYSFFEPNEIPSFYSIIKYLNDYPDLLDINKMHIQQALHPDVYAEISKYFQENKDQILEIKRKVYNAG